MWITRRKELMSLALMYGLDKLPIFHSTMFVTVRCGTIPGRREHVQPQFSSQEDEKAARLEQGARFWRATMAGDIML